MNVNNIGWPSLGWIKKHYNINNNIRTKEFIENENKEINQNIIFRLLLPLITTSQSWPLRALLIHALPTPS